MTLVAYHSNFYLLYDPTVCVPGSEGQSPASRQGLCQGHRPCRRPPNQSYTCRCSSSFLTSHRDNFLLIKILRSKPFAIFTKILLIFTFYRVISIPNGLMQSAFSSHWVPSGQMPGRLLQPEFWLPT